VPGRAAATRTASLVAVLLCVAAAPNVLASQRIPKPEAFVYVQRSALPPGTAVAPALAAALHEADAALSAAVDDYGAAVERAIAAEAEGAAPAEPLLDLSRPRGLCEALIARFGRSPGVDGAHYLLGWMAAEEGREDAALAAYQRLLTAFPRSPLAVEVRYRVGEIHFGAGRLAASARAYDRVVAAGETPFLALALYKRAWVAYRQGRADAAWRGFSALLARAEGAAPTDPSRMLRPEAVQYLALLLIEADLDGDGMRDRDAGAPRIARWLTGRAPHHAEVAAAAAQMAREDGDTALAERLAAQAAALGGAAARGRERP